MPDAVPPDPTVPVLFLDVDGVLNASRAGWSRAPRRTHVNTAERTFTIRWEPRAVGFLGDLHRSGAAEVRWCTTWQDEAVTCLAPALALPEFGVCRAPAGGVWTPGWKLAYVVAGIVHERRDVIWLDDEEITHTARAAVAAAAAEHGVSALLLPTSPSRGMRPDDVETITEFLAR